MAELKAGSRKKSAVCDTEVMVVMAPKGDVDLRCGGAAMIDLAAAKPAGGSPADAASGGTQIGKRYVNATGDLEILCTKPGKGSLALGDVLLEQCARSYVASTGRTVAAIGLTDVVVVETGNAFEVLATNTLTDQSFIASPILVANDIYLRSRTHLFRIGS